MFNIDFFSISLYSFTYVEKDDMNNLQEEEEENCVKGYNLLTEKNILIENILNEEELKIIDQLIFDTVDLKWKKVAFIIGQVLNQLRKNDQLSFFKDYKQYSDLLINQRINYFYQLAKLKINGNVKAMRFSEAIIA